MEALKAQKGSRWEVGGESWIPGRVGPMGQMPLGRGEA